MARIGFVTCVELGLSCIEEIYAQGGELTLIVTLKDSIAKKKSGRVYLDQIANAKNVPLIKVRNINDDDALEAIRSSKLDWLFIIGWSQIAHQEILDSVKLGVLGMHPTLLPKGRGRASIPWAILKNLNKTGVTVFKLDAGVDTGPIVNQHEIDLHSRMNATELYDLVSDAHVVLMGKVMTDILNESIKMVEQDDSIATIWEGRKPEDGEIDLKGSVSSAESLVRACTKPYPGAFYLTAEGKKVIVWKARVVDESSAEKNCLHFFDGKLMCMECS